MAELNISHENHQGHKFGFESDSRLFPSQAADPSRRRFLKLLALGTAGALLAGCAPEFPPPKTFIPEFSPNLGEAFGQDGLESIQKATSDYIDRYGSPLPTILFDTKDLSSDPKNQTFTDGSSLTVEEEAKPGAIYYNPSPINSSDQRNKRLREITIHSMTHACQPTEPTPLKEPMRLKNGTTLYAVQGMALLIELPDGTKTAFRAIEEGVCEALAVKLDPKYTVADKSYFQLGKLTLDIMNTYSSPYEVSDLNQKNGILKFIGIITKKTSPSKEDIERVMGWFQMARNLQNLDAIEADLVRSREE